MGQLCSLSTGIDLVFLFPLFVLRFIFMLRRFLSLFTDTNEST